jgi:hypothetical protein
MGTDANREKPRARYRRFEGKVVKDPATGKRMNGALIKEPMAIFRFLDGLLHGGRETGGIAVESADGYYEKWDRGTLKEAGTLMEDTQGKTWQETWEKGAPAGRREEGPHNTGATEDEAE